MRQKAISTLDKAIYWLIILLPFSIAIAPAPMNVFMGFLMVSFLIKKLLKKESLRRKITSLTISCLLRMKQVLQITFPMH